MKILFLQSAHYAKDDRVWYHQRAALTESGCEVEICGKEDFADFVIKGKTPDVIIVDTPRAMWKARKNKHTAIVYDITEWYPSKKNLRGLSLPHKLGKAILMGMANIWAGSRADAFLFGEEDKAKPFRFLFSHKPALLLPYYSDTAYIQPTPPRDIRKRCTLLYAGPLTEEKGWDHVLQAVNDTAHKLADVQFTLLVISQQTPEEQSLAQNVHIAHYPYLPFEEFCSVITQADIFLDLRDNDMENTRCLPIKLFYYMVCGRPSIYANLKAIPKGVPEIAQCACLVNSAEEAANAITRYIQSHTEYRKQCQNALHLAQTKYNWNFIKTPFVQLLKDIVHK